MTVISSAANGKFLVGNGKEKENNSNMLIPKDEGSVVHSQLICIQAGYEGWLVLWLQSAPAWHRGRRRRGRSPG